MKKQKPHSPKGVKNLPRSRSGKHIIVGYWINIPPTPDRFVKPYSKLADTTAEIQKTLDSQAKYRKLHDKIKKDRK